MALCLSSFIVAGITGVREPFGISLIVVLFLLGMCITDVMVAEEHDKMLADDIRNAESKKKWKKNPKRKYNGRRSKRNE